MVKICQNCEGSPKRRWDLCRDFRGSPILVPPKRTMNELSLVMGLLTKLLSRVGSNKLHWFDTHTHTRMSLSTSVSFSRGTLLVCGAKGKPQGKPQYVCFLGGGPPKKAHTPRTLRRCFGESSGRVPTRFARSELSFQEPNMCLPLDALCADPFSSLLTS